MGTHYEILGIESGSTAEQIKRAYRAKAKETHPDHCKAADAAERFKKVQAAYDVLSDPEKRKDYDFSLQRPKVAQPSRTAPVEGCVECGAVRLHGALRCQSCQQRWLNKVRATGAMAVNAAVARPRSRPSPAYTRSQARLEHDYGWLGHWGPDGLPRGSW